MKTYKIWVHIEEIDEDNDSYEDQGLPESCGEFGTLEEAESKVASIVDAFNN